MEGKNEPVLKTYMIQSTGLNLKVEIISVNGEYTIQEIDEQVKKDDFLSAIICCIEEEGLSKSDFSHSVYIKDEEDGKFYPKFTFKFNWTFIFDISNRDSLRAGMICYPYGETKEKYLITDVTPSFISMGEFTENVKKRPRSRRYTYEEFYQQIEKIDSLIPVEFIDMYIEGPCILKTIITEIRGFHIRIDIDSISDEEALEYIDEKSLSERFLDKIASHMLYDLSKESVEYEEYAYYNPRLEEAVEYSFSCSWKIWADVHQKETLRVGMVCNSPQDPNFQYVIVGIFPEYIILRAVSYHKNMVPLCLPYTYPEFIKYYDKVCRIMEGEELKKFLEVQTDPATVLQTGIYRLRKDVLGPSSSVLASVEDVIKVLYVVCDTEPLLPDQWVLTIKFVHFQQPKPLIMEFNCDSKLDGIRQFGYLLSRMYTRFEFNLYKPDFFFN